MLRCQVLANADAGLGHVLPTLVALNAYDPNDIDGLDYEKRLDAHRHMDAGYWSDVAMTSSMARPLLYNVLTWKPEPLYINAVSSQKKSIYMTRHHKIFQYK